MRHILLFLVALFLFASTAVFEIKPSFNEVDINNDNRVSIWEANEAGIPAQAVKHHDKNRNGFLNKQDWRRIDSKGAASRTS